MASEVPKNVYALAHNSMRLNCWNFAIFVVRCSNLSEIRQCKLYVVRVEQFVIKKAKLWPQINVEAPFSAVLLCDSQPASLDYNYQNPSLLRSVSYVK